MGCFPLLPELVSSNSFGGEAFDFHHSFLVCLSASLGDLLGLAFALLRWTFSFPQ